MKAKILGFAALFVFGFASSANALTITSGNSIGPDGDQECVVLGEQVRLNLSRGVLGVFECTEATNSIDVATCHEAGSRTNQLACVVSGQDEDGQPTYNDPLCNADNVGETVTLPAPRYRGFAASTTGGSVNARQLSSNCSVGNIESLL